MSDTAIQGAGWIGLLFLAGSYLLIIQEITENGAAFLRRPVPNARSVFAVLLGLAAASLWYVCSNYGFLWSRLQCILLLNFAILALVYYRFFYVPSHGKKYGRAFSFLQSLSRDLYTPGKRSDEARSKTFAESQQFRETERLFREAGERERQGKVSDTWHKHLSPDEIEENCFECGGHVTVVASSPMVCCSECLACGAKITLSRTSNGANVTVTLASPRRIVTVDNRLNAAITREELGFLYRIVDRLDDARKQLNAAKEELDALRAEHPGHERVLQALGRTIFRIGEIQLIEGDTEGAKSRLGEAQPIYERTGEQEEIDLVKRLLSTIS